MLTDEQINLIAHEARTRPPQEAARHLFPLIQHIAEADERACQNCRWWVRYDSGKTDRIQGECTNERVREGVRVVGTEGMPSPHVALLTPFDWNCRGHDKARPPEQEAQMSLG